jgi:hypothetical protein
MILPMSKLIALSEATSAATEPRIGFATQGGGQWAEWDRFITLDGKKAYHIGNVCGTCAFVFERLEGATDKVSPTELSGRLRSGLKQIDDDVVRTATSILPAGRYNVLLLRCVPRLVSPSKEGDYFFEEQVALWGLDGFWGVPHYAKVEYYRTAISRMSNHRGLFEFLVPMFPKNYLHAETISSYKKALSQRHLPTALAVSILDVKQPANWDGNPDVTEHWCLSHYLLDGHHKVYAASELGVPVSILSFLASEKGVSTQEQVAEAIEDANEWITVETSPFHSLTIGVVSVIACFRQLRILPIIFKAPYRRCFPVSLRREGLRRSR